jgi:hypothetical protein
MRIMSPAHTPKGSAENVWSLPAETPITVPAVCRVNHVKSVSLPIITVGEKIFRLYQLLDEEMAYAGYGERP